jgi:hypothetical protein
MTKNRIRGSYHVGQLSLDINEEPKPAKWKRTTNCIPLLET